MPGCVFIASAKNCFPRSLAASLKVFFLLTTSPRKFNDAEAAFGANRLACFFKNGTAVFLIKGIAVLFKTLNNDPSIPEPYWPGLGLRDPR